MKTIAYHSNTFLRPSESFIYEQVVNIKNYHVEILTRKYQNAKIFPYDHVNQIINNNKFKYSIDVLNYTLFRKCRYFEKIIEDKNISLIHSHYGIEGVYAIPIKEKFKIPLITTFHGHDITRLPKFSLSPPAWFNYWLKYKELQNKGNLFLGVSNFISNKLIAKGFPSSKVKTHYLGINTNVKIDKSNKDKTILTAGRLVEKKGTEYLIRALKSIIENDNSVKLLICGDGPLKGNLVKLAKTLKIDKNVIFLGWLGKDALFEQMNKSMIFVLPSIKAQDGDCEGLGMVILEAMAHELPVVGTMHGGIPEAIIDGETGFLVPERDHEKLSEKLRILISDYSLSTNMGKKGREYLLDKFNIRTQITKLEKIYKEYI